MKESHLLFVNGQALTASLECFLKHSTTFMLNEIIVTIGNACAIACASIEYMIYRLIHSTL